MEQSIEIVMSPDGQQVVSSKQVAKNFDKDHKHTLEYIRRILTDEKAAAKLFQETTYESRGKLYPMYLMNRDGFSLVAMGFNGKKALQWKLRYIAAFNQMEKTLIETKELTMNNAMMTKISEVEQSVLKLTSDLQKTGFLNPLVNYRHQFEQLNVYYRDATGDDSHRGIHEACGDYFGFPVPYSKDISTTLRDYVLCRIADDMDTAVDKLRMFIAGIKSKTIVLSSFGRWVNLNGFASNDVEWGKVLKEFDHKCAYCGKKTALMPEHIVPQSEMAKVNPHEVSLISSIVPSCGACNHSKNKNDMETWFRSQSFFTENKLKKIVRHHNKYKLNKSQFNKPEVN